MSERSEEIRQTEKRKRGRKNKKLQSLEQHFATGPVPKQSRSSMVDPMGRRKVNHYFKRISPLRLARICVIKAVNFNVFAYSLIYYNKCFFRMEFQTA